jgi:enoyl-CoA hydratase/carnithine racemase
VERSGAVAVWLDRPDKRNALDAEMMRALAAALDELRDDAAVHRPVIAVLHRACMGMALELALVSPITPMPPSGASSSSPPPPPPPHAHGREIPATIFRMDR